MLGMTNKTISLNLETTEKIDIIKLSDLITDDLINILISFNLLAIEIKIDNLKIVETNNAYTLMMLYSTPTINIPELDLNYVWTHYKSDDIYINPSKSNIIEIYVTGTRKDLKKGIEIYAPLTSSEITILVKDIESRKMVSDIIQVYNSSKYEVQIAFTIYKKDSSPITDMMLKTKIDTSLDKFFSVDKLPLGKHFHASKVVEWLHGEIEEISHITPILGENGENITPHSTLELLNGRIVFTQIVEKNELIDEISTPIRIIDIK